MAGRHAASAHAEGRPISSSGALLALFVAVLVVVGALVWRESLADRHTAAAACPGSVNVLAAPDIAPVLEQATVQLGEGASPSPACVRYRVRAVSSASALEAFIASPPQTPTLWVPDSSVWLGRAARSQVQARVLARSLAASPVVVVGASAVPQSWLATLRAGGVRLTDPATTGAGSAALLAVQSERARTGMSEHEVGAAMVPLAQRYGELTVKPTQPSQVMAGAGPSSPAVVTEQAAVQEGVHDTRVPRTGTVLLDFPMAALAGDARSREAGARLAAFLSGAHGRRLLTAHGFRTPQGQLLPSGRGVGAVRLLSPPPPEVIASTLREWTVLTMPSRALAVLDVSGSMAYTDATGQSRISLAVGAAGHALRLFPDTAQIGLWAFSTGLGGGGRDYRQMLPIRRLDTPVGSGTQRAALGKALAGLPRLTNGGTGLYATTLAALRAVRAGYDPKAVNSVILLTDGTNEEPGSMSLQDLLGAIRKERDPARPVIVVAIGMGPDADASALKAIADATGGRSYVARRPADITQVFQDALLSR